MAGVGEVINNCHHRPGFISGLARLAAAVASGCLPSRDRARFRAHGDMGLSCRLPYSALAQGQLACARVVAAKVSSKRLGSV